MISTKPWSKPPHLPQDRIWSPIWTGNQWSPNMTSVILFLRKETHQIPKQWKTSKTTLILKPGKEDTSHLMSSPRPISVTDCSYRVFAMMKEWMKAGNLISSIQKAVKATDGCDEHNALLNLINEKSLREKNGFHVVWLDLIEAFPSVPHLLSGLHRHTISLLQALYQDATSTYNLSGIERLICPRVIGVSSRDANCRCPYSALHWNSL